MKKYLSLVLALVLALSCSLLPSASAVITGKITTTKATECRSLVEFVELYSTRYVAYSSKDIVLSRSATDSPHQYGDILDFTTTAGSVGVHADTFKVHDVMMTFYSSTASDSYNNSLMDSCVMAISALEYDADYDDFSYGQKSAISAAQKLYLNTISPKIEEKFRTAVTSDDEVFLCSCNYDYYLACQQIGKGKYYVYLIAKERTK